MAHYPSSGDPVCKGFDNLIDAIAFLIRYGFILVRKDIHNG